MVKLCKLEMTCVYIFILLFLHKYVKSDKNNIFYIYLNGNETHVTIVKYVVTNDKELH